MCGTANNFAFHQYDADSLTSSRSSGRISCRSAADDDEALVEVHVVEVIGAVVVEVVVVDVELVEVVVELVDRGANDGTDVDGTATLLGQYCDG